MENEKKLLRKEYLLIRKNLSQKVVKQKSHKIFEKVVNLQVYKNAKEIFTYVSMDHEVDTIELIHHAINHNKRVAVPKVFPNRKLKFFYIDNINQLKVSSFGILEPKDEAKEGIPSRHSFLIVPGVVFDLQNNRIGYGGGFYDGFLCQYPNINNCALAYDFQILSKIPTELFDVQVQQIISD